MEPIRIEIVVENTAKDYRRVIVQLYRKAGIIAGALYLLIIPPMLWLAFFGAGASPFQEKEYSVVFIMILFALIPIGMAVGIIFSTSRRANKAGERIEPFVSVFDNDAVETKSGSYLSRVPWSTFIKARELKEDFVLYQHGNGFYSIPKRAFETEAKIDEFRHLIQAQMGKKAKLKNP